MLPRPGRRAARSTHLSGWILLALAASACGGDGGPVDDGATAGSGGLDAGAGGAGGDPSTGVVGAGGLGGAGGEGGGGGSGGDPLWTFGLPCVADGQFGYCLPTEQCAGADQHSVAGHCPGPADYQCCVTGAGVCDPTAEPQPNVGLVEAPGAGGCPDGMIPVAAFCVDVHEASLVRLDGSPWSPYVHPYEPVRAVSIEGAVPQGYVDQVTAEDACLASGKRLCTDEEWLRACQGPGGTTYPYGDEAALGTCNDHRAVHPAVEYFGTTEDWIFSELDNACLNQLPSSLATCGAHPGCVTAEGALDMMGNLHEWTSDPNGTFRGGFYVDTSINGPGCLYKTTAHDVHHWDYSTGFRCCADP
jgi:hypothetical protein